MANLYRRSSGTYAARLVVPQRHRQTLGRAEFVASTGSKELAVARLVAGRLVAAWRLQIYRLDHPEADLNFAKLIHCEPQLAFPSYRPLREAAAVSGIDEPELLRAAERQEIRLFIRSPALLGHRLRPYGSPRDPGDVERFGEEYVVPCVEAMTSYGPPQPLNAVLECLDAADTATALLTGRQASQSLFLLTTSADSQDFRYFRPVESVTIDVASVHVFGPEVDALRQRLVDAIPEHRRQEIVTAPAGAVAVPKGNRFAQKRMSEAVEAFMIDRKKHGGAEQQRRHKRALDIFVELTGDGPVCAVDRDQLKHYRDHVLPLIPANENKVRLQLGTTSVSESIARIEGSDWPRLSVGEQVKQMDWLLRLTKWMTKEKWLDEDHGDGLNDYTDAKKSLQDRPKRSARENRRVFTYEDLQTIFGQPWFLTGRGELTRAATYRTFQPFHYWGPLIALHTGARLNEIAQLHLTDLREAAPGVWMIDINDDADDSKERRKKLKNGNSVRQVPLHPSLIELGLASYATALGAAGHDRLFPELTFDKVKGYGKGAGKWFSALLKRLGWERDGTKTFHSFRHTLSTHCVNVLRLSDVETAQISGHSRGSGTLMSTYRKDLDAIELFGPVSRVDFKLPRIAPFHVEEALAAVRHALGRKNRGCGPLDS